MNRHPGDGADVLQGLGHVPALVFELLLVAQKLPGAPAADAAVAAGGGHPVGGRRQNLLQPGFGVVALLAGDADAGLVARDRPLHKNRQSVEPGDAFSAEGQPCDIGFDNCLLAPSHMWCRLKEHVADFKDIRAGGRYGRTFKPHAHRGHSVCRGWVPTQGDAASSRSRQPAGHHRLPRAAERPQLAQADRSRRGLQRSRPGFFPL